MLKFENGLILDGCSDMELGELSLKNDEEIVININQTISHGDLLDLIKKLQEIEKSL